MDTEGSTTTRTIESIIDAINRAWLDGRPLDAAKYFHPAVVVLPPGFGERVTGRDACMQSYADFVRVAMVEEFVADPPAIDVFDNTAVALCPLRIRYSIGGTSHHEQGHEILVFHSDGDQWMVVWRTASYQQIPSE